MIGYAKTGLKNGLELLLVWPRLAEILRENRTPGEQQVDGGMSHGGRLYQVGPILASGGGPCALLDEYEPDPAEYGQRGEHQPCRHRFRQKDHAAESCDHGH